MKQKIYEKLVDLYAGDELPTELMEELEQAAFNDPALSHDMQTMSATVRTLRADPAPEFTNESFHRILMKMYQKGAVANPISPEPSHLQLRLPLSG